MIHASKKLSLAATLALCLLANNNVIAEDSETDSQATKNISTTGGFMIGTPDDEYWFQIGGGVRFDQHFFMGNQYSKGNEFLSGANLRNFEIDFNGGIGKNLSYSVVTLYGAKSKNITLEDAYVTYEIQKDFTVSVGQVLPGYSLEAATSSKWIPFLERSMPTFALGTNLGLGVNVNKWDDSYTFIAAAMQPKIDHNPQNSNASTGSPNSSASTLKRNDRWATSARVAYRPIFTDNDIVQVGVSGYFADDHGAYINFSSNGEAVGRNNTNVLDTGYFAASNHKGVNLELAGQHGPLYGQAEYQRVFISQGNSLDKLHFDGFHVLVSYVLTGEAKSFKEFNGTFGQVKPAWPSGAWEVAARYSYLDLTSKVLNASGTAINGGKGKNASLGLNYYANNNVRISAEYIRSLQQPSLMLANLANTSKRGLNTFGLRLQAVF